MLPPLERLTVPEERVALELLPLVEAVRELRTVPLKPFVALRELLLVTDADLEAERLSVTLRPVERLAPPRAENPLE